MKVIAMGYGGAPLERSVAAVTPRLAYLVRLSPDDSKVDDGISGVGFPLKFVFRHDPVVLESLLVAWEGGDRSRLESGWAMLSPAFDAQV